MEHNAPNLCDLPVRYGVPTKKKIVVGFDENELESERWTCEPILDFIEVLQRNAREMGVIAKDDSILTLQMAKDGSDPDNIDNEDTLGDILESLGNRDLVAVLESRKATRAPAIYDHLPIVANASPEDAGVEHSLSERQDQPQNIASPSIASASALHPSAQPPFDGAPSSDRADNPLVLLTRRAEKTGRGPRPAPVTVTFDQLRQIFNLPRYEAAKQLGLAKTDVYFKKLITDFGLMTWPYRSKRSLESTMQGLEYAIAEGGYGANVYELRAVVTAARKTYDLFQTGSAEVINALVFPPQPIVPKKVCNFLSNAVGWRVRKDHRVPQRGPNRNAGGADDAENAAPLVAKSGRGNKEEARAGKRKTHSESDDRSSRRLKRQSRASTMKHKGDSGFADAEDGSEESEYQPTSSSDGGSESDDSLSWLPHL